MYNWVYKTKVNLSIKNMKFSIFILSVFSSLVFFFQSCTSTSEQELRWAVIYCEDSLVSFQSSILPMMNTSCNSCHSGSSPSGNVRLDNYNDVKIYAANGSLMGVINHSPGFTPMPIGKPKWNECRINTLQTWINEGMLNN